MCRRMRTMMRTTSSVRSGQLWDGYDTTDIRFPAILNKILFAARARFLFLAIPNMTPHWRRGTCVGLLTQS
jgi:hypothetical protein